MTTRNALLTALLAASLAPMACTTNPKADGGVDAGEVGCLDSDDCPDPQLFFCNTTKSKCEPACRSKEQCTASVRGQFALDFCAGALGCQCDEGKCEAALCSADRDCGETGTCRNGKCVAAPAASTVATCQVTPDLVVMKKGSKAKFWVSTWDAANNPVVIKEGATWAAISGGPLMGSGTGPSVEFTANTVTTGDNAVASVEATVGTAKCQAKAIVLPDVVAADQVAVVVVDELSGRPVAGVDVVISKPDGEIVAQVGATSVKTDPKGYATLSITGAGAQFSVTAFAQDHAYVTIANYPATGSRMLSIVTRRNQADKYGGYKGTFTNVPATVNVHAALAGMSLPGSITSLSLAQLLGPSVPTDIKIGTAVDEQNVPIPAGVFLGFSEQVFKGEISGQGLAGVCFDAAGAADEARIAKGECGTRAAWGLTGDVRIEDLPLTAIGSISTGNVGDVLAQILPIFKKFNSSVVRDVRFNLVPTPLDKDGAPDFSDAGHFTVANQSFSAEVNTGSSLPLAFSFAAKVPDLPKFRGSYVDAAVIIGGANMPGRGVVPLGIGLGVNTDGNAQIDKVSDGLPGVVPVRMAPAHHGLEGSEYGLIVAALSAKSLSDVTAGVGLSAIFARVAGNKLVFDPSGASKIDVSSLSFPVMPDGIKFNYATTAIPGVPGRTLRMVNNPSIDFSATGMTVIRASFADDLDRRWDVVADAATLSSGFTLPRWPTQPDRLFANNLSTGSRSSLVVQALRLNTNPGGTGGSPISFLDYVEFNSTNADRTTDFLTGFSVMDVTKPDLKFTSPKKNPATIGIGTKVALEVAGFIIGTAPDADGVVKLSFTAAGAPVAGCTEVVLEAETTKGNGVLEHLLPGSCVGANITLTAQLMLADKRTPIAPAVSTTTVVTIQ